MQNFIFEIFLCDVDGSSPAAFFLSLRIFAIRSGELEAHSWGSAKNVRNSHRTSQTSLKPISLELNSKWNYEFFRRFENVNELLTRTLSGFEILNWMIQPYLFELGWFLGFLQISFHVWIWLLSNSLAAKFSFENYSNFLPFRIGSTRVAANFFSCCNSCLGRSRPVWAGIFWNTIYQFLKNFEIWP